MCVYPKIIEACNQEALRRFERMTDEQMLDALMGSLAIAAP